VINKKNPQNGTEEDDQVVLESNTDTEGMENVANTEGTENELQTKLCKAAVGDSDGLKSLDELHGWLKRKKALGGSYHLMKS